MSRAWEAHEQEWRAMIGCERESVPQGTKHIRWDPVDQAELISRYRLRPRLVGSPHRLDSSWMRVVAQHVCLGLVVNSCVVCDCPVTPCSSSRWDWEAERICEGQFFRVGDSRATWLQNCLNLESEDFPNASLSTSLPLSIFPES